MWLLAQHTGLSSPHGSGDSGPGVVAASSGICDGVCSPPGCTAFISWLCGSFLCPRRAQCHSLSWDLQLYFSWIKSLPSPLQVFLPLPYSPVSGSPAVLLIDTLRGV